MAMPVSRHCGNMAMGVACRLALRETPQGYSA